MALGQSALTAQCLWCVPMDSVDLTDWLISRGSPMLTIHNEGPSANKQRYNKDQQIYEKDRLLTKNRRGDSHRNVGLLGPRIGLYLTDIDGVESPKNQNKQSENKVVAKAGRMDLGARKKVTFDPSHIRRSDSESADESSSQKSTSPSGRRSLDIEPSANKIGTVGANSRSPRPSTRATSTVHRASSETKLSKGSSLLGRSASVSTKRGADLRTAALSRCDSEKALSTLCSNSTTSVGIAKKEKKRRGVIKKILKIQKAFKKKRGPSLEESEDTADYPQGSDESDDIPKTDVLGFLNGKEVSVDVRESPVSRPHQLTISHSARQTDSENSPLQHRGSSSSLDLDSPALKSDSIKGSSNRLKPIATSPAALNTLTGSEGGLSEASISPQLTPTRDNFDDSQLIGPSTAIAYHPHTHTLSLQNDSMRKTAQSTSSLSKQGSSRKKKRSGSWYNNVLSSSYRQKNEDFHKFFKDLPVTERLLVDYTCALVKDILVQGRLYVSQNYLCFHSNILKWQTAVNVSLIEIGQMTKEKTVKVIPNAIQVLMKDKTKMTFTSFTARDRAYLTIFTLWQNALLDKPISAVELWSQIHRNYGEELGGCSSDDDYVRPKYIPRKHQSLGNVESDLKYEFGTTNKIKKKKKLSSFTQTPQDGDFDRDDKTPSKSSRQSSQDSPVQFQAGTDSTGEDKSSHSSQDTQDDMLVENEPSELGDSSKHRNEDASTKDNKAEESDDEPTEFAMEDCAKVSLNRVYETTARDLFRIIFGDDCPFSNDNLVKKGTTNITFGTWTDHEENIGQKIRELTYTLRLDNPIGPKTSAVKETQIYYSCSVEGKTYVVDCHAQNYGIPYADYFHTCMRYCIRKVSKTDCELRVTSELRYRKTPWGLVKNFIEKNVASGLTDNFRNLENQLQERIDWEKSQPQLVEGVNERKNSNLRRRKRRSETSAGDLQKRKSRLSTTPSLPNGGGDMRLSSSDMNNNKSRSSSPEVMTGAPSRLPSNGYIPNDLQHSYETDRPKLHYFGQGGKFIIGAILFIFILLIYSNYSMYQRLTTLEQVTAAAATADGVDPSVTAALLDRPGVPITSNPEILSTYLQAIDKRLRRLEDTVLKFTENSNVKWDTFEKNWMSLQNMIQTIVKQQGAKGR